jgi:hypothetical protein
MQEGQCQQGPSQLLHPCCPVQGDPQLLHIKFVAA